MKEVQISDNLKHTLKIYDQIKNNSEFKIVNHLKQYETPQKLLLKYRFEKSKPENKIPNILLENQDNNKINS